eukprot:TRINITY_DN779_c0_g1_i1.p1 TRINITY_DN779_c0_g1~~TRINITY_DN779_c0_g1_i1.p1  ORF type:complete len:478 (+),score=99.56 TRINITY_DN779_c0_g1_i1:88-1521(+)
MSSQRSSGAPAAGQPAPPQSHAALSALPAGPQETRIQLLPDVLVLSDQGQAQASLEELLTEHRTRNPQAMQFEPRTPIEGGIQVPLEPEEDAAIIRTDSLRRIGSSLARPAAPTAAQLAGQAILRHIFTAWSPATRSFNHGDRQRLHTFVEHIRTLCRESIAILKRVARLVMVHVRSPVYVFGDIHGNFHDLHFFLQRLIPFGDIRFAPSSFLFLGDYVDRGPQSLECILYLLSLLVISAPAVAGPEHGVVTLLRGNHESPEVNMDIASYGVSSFLHQCREVFNGAFAPQDAGLDVCQEINNVFTYLPICATIDKKIFCSHGGIPRFDGGPDDRIERLTSRKFPRFVQIQQQAPDEPPEQRAFRIITNDLLWSDPAEDEHDPEFPLNEYGFGANPRGPGTIAFGSKAVDHWLQSTGFQYVFRAHQEKGHGLRLSKAARVVTIFSTSNYQDHHNGAGVVFFARNRIRLVVKTSEDPQC